MAQKFKVLVSDSLAASGLAPLKGAPDVDLHIATDLTPAALVACIGEYDALLVRSSTQVTGEVIQAAKRLRVVARAGVGVDNIDVDAATQAGVIVVNAPTGNVVAAAEHTVAMLLAMARLIPQADAHVRAGKWQRSQFMGVEVRDKVLGAVGLGRVAQEVVRRAQGLGMTVIAYDPYVTAEYASQRGVRLVDLPVLLAEADFVTCHVPMTPQTRGLIGRAEFDLMKEGVHLVNVARGGIVDEDAMVDAIEAGKVAGAALDVFSSEPLAVDSRLRSSSKIILTPHLGGSTVEAQEQVAEDVALQVLEVLHDRPARYAVNAPLIPPKDLDFLVPYIDLAERLGRFLYQLCEEGVSEVEVTAHGDLAGFDLSYVNAAVIKGLLSEVVQVRVNLVNARLLAERRGINLIERKLRQHEARYENMLTLRALTGGRHWTVRGSVLQGEPCIVGINDLWVDFQARGNFLLSAHHDRPGIIGRVGTRLGKDDINISFMHVGRRGPRTEAIMVVGTDELVPPALQTEIESYPYIIWLKAVTL